jgi:hypothetical protein
MLWRGFWTRKLADGFSFLVAGSRNAVAQTDGAARRFSRFLSTRGRRANVLDTPAGWFQNPANRAMITLKTFDFPEEAHLLRLHLESGGFHVFIADELMVGNYWPWSYVIRGIKVQIAEADVEAARRFLVESAALAEHEEFILRCPACQSLRVEEASRSRRLALVAVMFFHVLLPFSRHIYRCLACKRTWKYKGDGLKPWPMAPLC